MRISTRHTASKTEEIIQVLNTGIQDTSTKRFGRERNKTVIAKKSAFVGVQIARRAHELIIAGTLPSLLSDLLSEIRLFEGLFYMFEFMFRSQWEKPEMETGTILSQKYC
ncbi:hypothetical protein SAMN04488029_3733 [Reichenbachiella faecimaris]|uniref:Uncharacterized protein n=1 Tax=Reichenbachiella faecimaris TaxID=692418 RepID=A0A1W2GNR0_REIFA|nr:hypothetical protein [Reichenbachiella faecimaris]SMD38295.1 hypothetical protein SAMN04488029_3733 [Reichenbachiella faecimaris]